MPGLSDAVAPLLLLAALPLAHASCAQGLASSSAATEKLAWLSATRPQKAGTFSALLPGAGQVYNGQAWKGPLVYGALAGSVYAEVQYWRLYSEYKAGYKTRVQLSRGNTLAIDTGPHSSQEPSDAAQLYRFNSYRTSRDLLLGLNALIYGLQILAAVTIAHLHDFDINENLALRWQPTALPLASSGWAPGLRVALTVRSSNRSS
ncbi:hypothetical protein HMJ29_01620 [Hymenobacter taeanensis]|uniref:DUF5683 domain-containing protein n=1 Tax=Hymenobacter taeanensis TaxID=2735321 RepID=A0A6M6BER4_9BACT|nr:MULTISPECIES: DUF5683 domain-containing protein [Hymenobacter]QJX45703.1 hypothetical protein HMJ29_01620 [Hymenobacter taeanensis]UOQ79541.1 DUF5683 domain-containing protein [Hymenobacter sp. 5414T-23]